MSESEATEITVINRLIDMVKNKKLDPAVQRIAGNHIKSLQDTLFPSLGPEEATEKINALLERKQPQGSIPEEKIEKATQPSKVLKKTHLSPNLNKYLQRLNKR